MRVDSECVKRQVVCTGMGIIAPKCHSVPEFSKILHQGKSIITDTNINGQRFLGAFLDTVTLDEGFKTIIQEHFPKAKGMYSRACDSIKASMQAAGQAFLDANLPNTVDKERIGIVVAGSNLTNKYSYDTKEKLGDQLDLIHPRYALDFFDTAHMGYVSEMLGINGEGITVGGASASGNVALIKARQMIQLNIVDVCIVVGAMADLSPLEMMAFKNIGAYGGKEYLINPQAACRPFDKKHEGFLMGQAAACMVLEGKDFAKERNANIYTELVGGAQILDGTRLSDPNVNNQIKTMKKALLDANITANEVSYINTHGTSTPRGDISELNAIVEVFGESLEHIWLNSTKTLVGHCLFSAGIVEAIACIVQMKEGFVHGMPNLEQPIRENLNIPKGDLAMKNMNIQYILSNSYGFTGINTSIVLKNSNIK